MRIFVLLAYSVSCLVAIAANKDLEAQGKPASVPEVLPYENGSNFGHQNAAATLYRRRRRSMNLLASLAFVAAAAALGFIVMHCYMALRSQFLSKDHDVYGRRLSESGSKECSVSQRCCEAPSLLCLSTVEKGAQLAMQ